MLNVLFHNKNVSKKLVSSAEPKQRTLLFMKSLAGKELSNTFTLMDGPLLYEDIPNKTRSEGVCSILSQAALQVHK